MWLILLWNVKYILRWHDVWSVREYFNKTSDTSLRSNRRGFCFKISSHVKFFKFLREIGDFSYHPSFLEVKAKTK